MADESRHTIVVALEVTDEETYTRYRAGMRPILAEYGGRFDWDLRGGEVLTSPQGATVNRVFAISFPSRERRVAFFDDPRYREVRETWFDPSVAQTYTIATEEG